MCRLAIYKGPEIPLSRFILDPPHSIFTQSYEADEMLSGRTNADGFGIGWYNLKLGPTPALYRSTTAIWNDSNLPRMMNKISSEIILAHVRGASDGMPVTSTNTHPFSFNNYMLMHNGAIDEFRKSIFPEILKEINPSLWEFIKGNTDSEHLFALWLSRLDGWPSGRTDGLDRQLNALRETVQFLEVVARRKKIDMVLNLGISDGENIIATRYHFGKRKATLYYIENSKSFPNSNIIASEKMFDDSHWQAVPERSFVVLTKENRLSIHPF
jgi:ergothioneine biosynthesis protein EgtC